MRLWFAGSDDFTLEITISETAAQVAIERNAGARRDRSTIAFDAMSTLHQFLHAVIERGGFREVDGGKPRAAKATQHKVNTWLGGRRLAGVPGGLGAEQLATCVAELFGWFRGVPDFLVWETTAPAGAYQLGMLECRGFDSYRLDDLDPVAADWPPDATIAIDRSYGGSRLLDCHRAIGRLIVSERIAAALTGAPVELLPVTVQSHPRFLVHPLRCVDALDRTASEARPAPADRDHVQVRRIVLSTHGELPPLFRLAGVPTAILVSRSLAAAVEATGATGLRWTELLYFATA